MIRLVFDLLLLTLVVFISYRLYTRYKAAEGTRWVRIKTAGLASATIIWQYFVMAGSAVLAFADKIADVLNVPEFKEAVGNIAPETAAKVLMGIAAITILARMRSLLFPSKAE